jgi:phosphoesterase RecJ-like protein
VNQEPPARLPNVEEALTQACDRLRDAQRILLTSHRRPDGDGTGSMCGLASLLRAVGKTAVIYSVDPIARRYKWMPLANTCVHTIPFDERFDCTIVVDCAGHLAARRHAAPARGLRHVDHARSPRERSPVRRHPGVGSRRLRGRRAGPSDRPSGSGGSSPPRPRSPLYVSVISDTGGFRHANTNAEALHVGSSLVAAGVVPSTIAASLDERPSPGKLRPARLGAVDARAALRGSRSACSR